MHRSKPEFLKVLLRDFSLRLQIPPTFVKHIRVETSKEVILEGPSGNIWLAKINKTKDGMFLEDGWDYFVKDHSLKVGEILVFVYDGGMRLCVKIFDRSACWREDVFDVKPSQDLSIGQEKRRRGRPRKSFKREKLGREGKSSLDLSHLSQHLKKFEENQHEPQDPCNELLETLQGQRAMPSKLSSPNRIVRRNAREAAYSFSSKFPKFVAEMKSSCVHYPCNLSIPILFSREHFPRIQTEMVLRNPEGTTWVVSYHFRETRSSLARGWGAFAHDNNLKEGDYCVFELVDKLVMCVNIFPI